MLVSLKKKDFEEIKKHDEAEDTYSAWNYF